MNFEETYNQHQNLVYNLALNYVQNAEDAQEITQDVFVAVYQSQDTFQGASTVSTWLYRITINKCLDFLKARKRKKRFAFITSLFFEGSNEVKHHAPEYNHPGVLLENKEALEHLFKKINELPDNQKTALILHKIEQKTQVEIAEIIGVSPKAVESLIQRAKTNLLKSTNNSEG